VRRFLPITNEFPWGWLPGHIEEWTLSVASRGCTVTLQMRYRSMLASRTAACKGEVAPATFCARRRRMEAAGRITVRAIISWCAVATPFVVAAIRSIERGWSAVGDDCVIAIRAFDELGRHGPLVGQFSQLSPGATHSVYDPGPLQYWLLAIPAHIDPRYGPMWGSALWCVVAGVLAVGATRSVLGEWGGLGAAAFFVGIVTWSPAIAVDAIWNPYFGSVFFLAAIAATWAALCGRSGWWPVAVFLASVAAQAHLMFAVASALLVLVAGASCLVSTLRSEVKRFGWLAAGLLFGLGCWIAPIVQQLSSRSGNLATLITSQSGQQWMGPGFGLRAFAAASFTRPIWWTSAPHLSFFPVLEAIGGASSVVAVAVLGLLAVVGVLAFVFHERRLSALCAVTLVCACSLVATFADIPPGKLLAIDYIITAMYPAGCLCWLTAIATVIVGVRLLVVRLTHSRLETSDYAGEARFARQHALLRRSAGITAAVLAVLSLGGLVALTQTEQAADASSLLPWASMREVPRLAATAKRMLAGNPRPVLVMGKLGPGVSPWDIYPDILGLAWAMHAGGWTPLIGHPWGDTLGSFYAPRRGVSEVLVTLDRSGAKLQVITETKHDHSSGSLMEGSVR
jgi:hypothetical protein